MVTRKRIRKYLIDEFLLVFQHYGIVFQFRHSKEKIVLIFAEITISGLERGIRRGVIDIISRP